MAFDQKTNERLDLIDTLKRRQQNPSGNYGIIQSYDSETNSATVLMTAVDSDLPSDILTGVLCPVTLGVQTVAPESGRPCWVVFKGTFNDRRAIISHYFNHRFETHDYGKQYVARSSIPRYTLGM